MKHNIISVPYQLSTQPNIRQNIINTQNQQRTHLNMEQLSPSFQDLQSIQPNTEHNIINVQSEQRIPPNIEQHSVSIDQDQHRVQPNMQLNLQNQYRIQNNACKKRNQSDAELDANNNDINSILKKKNLKFDSCTFNNCTFNISP